MGIEAAVAVEPTAAGDPAYPSALGVRETALIARRRKAAGTATNAADGSDPVGVCLSGGGIRSATFCLGVFQALARLKLVPHIDLLSTVSGGGYFGSFFGRLFTRPYVAKAEDVAAVLTAEKESGVLRNLRENGRYLAPNGAGDALAAVAIIVRNWVALQIVLCAALMTVLLPPLALERFSEIYWPPTIDTTATGSSDPSAALLGFVGALRAASPWWIGALAVGALFVYPLGAAYWWLDGARKSTLGAFLRAAILPAVVAALWRTFSCDAAGAQNGWRAFLADAWIPATVGAAFGVTAAFVGMAATARSEAEIGGGGAGWWICAAPWLGFAHGAAGNDAAPSPAETGARETRKPADAAADSDAVVRGARRLLSERLAAMLALGVVFVVLGAVDAAGRTLYAELVATGGVTVAVGGVAAMLGTVAGFIRPILNLLGVGESDRRPSLPLGLIAWAAAIVVAGAIFVGGSVLAHAFSHRFASSSEVVAATAKAQAAAAAWLGFLILSAWFGRSRSFPNLSGQHLFYAARLTRAYVGASNPTRLGAHAKTLTETCPGDDAAAHEYWRLPDAAAANAAGEARSPYLQGAPLHFVNVTVNETVDGRSQVQQQDRKGLGLAVGPFGVSLGVRHHVVRPWSAGDAESPRTFPEANAASPAPHRAFAEQKAPTPNAAASLAAPHEAPQALSVGSWVGISGAAFSTGIGARTNLAMAFLCGLFNVRLGYWWNPGEKSSEEERAADRRTSAMRRFLLRLFPAQTYVVSEFLARFPGTAWPRWYLSDGGHFENMGGYELVRRRVRRIVMVDAEQDGDYRFEGLANFVRKARIDFGAEVRFLETSQLNDVLAEDVRPFFGTLDDLRRGVREEAPPRPDGAAVPGAPTVLVETDATRRSWARAALAKITYRDGSVGFLVYLKPTLLGDEPADVVQYQAAHPDFPHETTADQFFDEEQWESYRALGEHAALQVFAARGQANAAVAAPREKPAAPSSPGSPPSAPGEGGDAARMRGTFRPAEMFDRTRPLPQ
jgi:hypothetical protein